MCTFPAGATLQPFEAGGVTHLAKGGEGEVGGDAVPCQGWGLVEGTGQDTSSGVTLCFRSSYAILCASMKLCICTKKHTAKHKSKQSISSLFSSLVCLVCVSVLLLHFDTFYIMYSLFMILSLSNSI